jgi:hypothetical protein
MPKDDHRDTPEGQSRGNAISSRKVEPVRTPALAEHGFAVAGATVTEEGILIHTQPSEDTLAGDMDAMGTVPSLTADHPAAPQVMGNVPSIPVSGDPAADPASRAKSLAASVMNRLKADGRWFGLIALERDQMMREAKAAIPDLVQRQLWVYGELDRMYPPVQAKQADCDMASVDTKGLTTTNAIRIALSGSDEGSIQGLSDVPKDWPDLPANASLSLEVGWVQANRLFMVEERPGRATIVRLDRAASPAPSRAALGWLETSIRSYAKYVDVAAKATSTSDDEGAVLRRERKSIEEVEALLQEMCEATGACPHCGRAG